ncbi:MAG: NUDIX hydrolase [Thermodesulfobacteriota bacterium]
MEEFIDILDENGNFTGIIKSREEVHEKGYLHKTIHVWVVNSKNEILIQKRSATKLTHPGMWDVSCAGHVSADQTSKQAAIDELYEETGLLADKSELNYIVSIEKKFFKDKIKDNEIYDVYLVNKDMDLDKLNCDPEEVEKLDLIKAEQFFKNAKTKSDFINNEKEYFIMKKILLE